MYTVPSHINPKLFDADVSGEANRMGFGRGLKAVGATNDSVVALCADLMESTRMIEFAEAYPERFIEMGIAEQSMASVASGMAAMGKIPFIASYAMFSPGRNWEQIRTTIAYNNANVKIIGAHSGVSVGPDGATHQAIEDIALMRVMPNMVVLAPSDGIEAEKATLAVTEFKGPVYMRLAREKTPTVTTRETPFAIGKAEVYMERDPAHIESVGIITTGTTLFNAMVAGKRLNEKGIGASVLHLATIKPFDEQGVLAFARNHTHIITVEEHQIAGGMGSAVAEFLSLVHPKHILRMGVHDMFGQSGTLDELFKHYMLDADSIVQSAERLHG